MPFPPYLGKHGATAAIEESTQVRITSFADSQEPGLPAR
jgi:hypothetical protein